MASKHPFLSEDWFTAVAGLIETFNGINALRQHITPDARIHGIITHGGDAPNIVPEYARAVFFVPSATGDVVMPLLDQYSGLAKKVG